MFPFTTSRSVRTGLLALWGLALAADSRAQTCLDDVARRNTNCTAKDVNLTAIRVLRVVDGCSAVGDTATLLTRAELIATSAFRYDLGLFLALDGGNARTGVCLQDYLPPPLAPIGADDPSSGVGPYLDAEDDPRLGDSCGDLEQGVLTLRNLAPIDILCKDDDGDGLVDPLAFCVSWDNQVSSNCFGLGDTLPGTPAKCNCDKAPLDPVVRIGCASDLSCDDGLLCNGVELCLNGSCLSGTPLDCSDLDPCTVDSCDPGSGTCKHRCETDPPVLDGVPADTTVECDAVPKPALVRVSDCDPDPRLTYQERRIDGACPDSYRLERTWTAVDDCGNSASRTQVIEVRDTRAPVLLGVPADAAVECDAVPPPATVTATDNCDPDPVLSYREDRTPGSCPGNYVLTRTWSARDRCGNVASAVQTITVVDSRGPIIVQQPTIGGGCAFLWPPQHGYVEFTVHDTAMVAIDNCGPVTLEFSGCASSQPEDNRGSQNAGDGGDGHSLCDCALSPDGQAVALRAERNGACRPLDRTYGLAIDAVDACGNRSSSLPFEVCVYHDQGHRPPPTGPVYRANPESRQKDNRCAEGWINGTYPAASARRGSAVCGAGCSLDCDPTQRER